MKVIFKLYKSEFFKDMYYLKNKHSLAYDALLAGHVACDSVVRVISPFSIKNKRRYSI